jgi:hypothetical protein
MIKFLSMILLLTSLSAVSAEKYVYGEGRFWAEDGDSLVFVKNQLLYTAFINVISKELETMGLDPEIFWQKYNDKFEVTFKGTQEKLIAKYKIEKKPTEAQKNKYKKSLRSLKLKKKRKFMSLGSIIRSFAIKKMSRSAVNHQSRFLSLEAKVNRISLNKLFYKMMREKQNSNYTNLYVIFEYELRDTNWSDIGVDGESIFTEEVNSHWVKWFDANKPDNIEKVIFLNKDAQSEVKEHLRLGEADIVLHGNTILKSSLLLTNKIVLRKENIESNFKEFKFHYSGGQVLIDLATNRAVLENDISHRYKSYFDVAEDKLSSAIANYVYRLPLDNFSQVRRKIQKMLVPKMSKKIFLSGFRSIGQVMKFKKYLQDFGAKLRIRTRLSSFGREKSEVVVFYQGDDTILMNFLVELKKKSKTSEVEFDFIDPAQPFQIKFVKKEKPELERVQTEV